LVEVLAPLLQLPGEPAALGRQYHLPVQQGVVSRPTGSLAFSETDFFLIGIVGSGVQLGPLGTAATNRPIVPAPGDYGDGGIGGMMTGRGNRSIRRKPAPVPLCSPQTPHTARTRTRAAAVGSQRLTA
jgi:hypothetical protein